MAFIDPSKIFQYFFVIKYFLYKYHFKYLHINILLYSIFNIDLNYVIYKVNLVNH